MSDPERFPIAPIGVWTGALDYVSTSRARELAAELESLGYGAIWIPEVAGRDVFVHLTSLLSATTKVVGATGIANIWGRDALAMAGAAKALTEAFPERFLLGLGVSHQNLVEDLRGHHDQYHKPLSAMERYIEAMDKAPYSAERPQTPLRRVLAALGPKMLALAAARTDGAHSYFVTPEHTATAREILGGTPLLCVEQAVLVETDPSEARRVGRVYTSLYLSQPNYVKSMARLGFSEEDISGGGTDSFVDALVAWGSVDQIRERVGAHLDAGADHVCIQPLDPQRRGVPSKQWRELAPAMSELAAKRSATKS